MTLAPEAPATAVDSPPEVAAVAGMLRQLWPDMPELMASRHARTFVRIAGRTYGPADAATALRMSVLVQPTGVAAVDPDTKIDVRGDGLYLMAWSAEHDRRPKTKVPRWADPHWAPGGPGRGTHGHVGSARHGECTPCIKDHSRIRQAVYRLTDQAESWCRSSYCEQCARKLIGGPVAVPRFGSPEEAQAWLDANGD